MKYWTTQSGEKLAVKDMTISHIQNCIKMLERLLVKKPDPEWGDPNDSDGVAGAIMAENFANDLLEERIISAINSFKRELKRRG